MAEDLPKSLILSDTLAEKTIPASGRNQFRGIILRHCICLGNIFICLKFQGHELNYAREMPFQFLKGSALITTVVATILKTRVKTCMYCAVQVPYAIL